MLVFTEGAQDISFEEMSRHQQAAAAIYTAAGKQQTRALRGETLSRHQPDAPARAGD